MKRKRIEDGKVIQFWNCNLLRNHQIIKDDLWIRGGIILDPHVVFFDENVAADVKIDCKGLLIAPGYIDVQINGNTVCIKKDHRTLMRCFPFYIVELYLSYIISTKSEGISFHKY